MAETFIVTIEETKYFDYVVVADTTEEATRLQRETGNILGTPSRKPERKIKECLTIEDYNKILPL